MAKFSNNRQTIGFCVGDIEELFQQSLLRNNQSLLSWKEIPFSRGDHLCSVLSEQKSATERLTDMHAFEMICQLKDGVKITRKMALNSRKLDWEMIQPIVAALTTNQDSQLKSILEQYFPKAWEFDKSHVREILVANEATRNGVLSLLVPTVFHTLIDEDDDKYVSLHELIEPSSVVHFNVGNAWDEWEDASCYKVLRSLARFHAEYLDNHARLGPLSSALYDHTARFLEAPPLWEAVLERVQNLDYCQPYLTPARIALLRSFLNNLPTISSEIAKQPKAFIHNDVYLGTLGHRPMPTPSAAP